MTTSDTLRTLTERLRSESPRAVFGDPIAAHGRTLIPVARVGYGFGATGGNPAPTGEEVGGSGGGGLGAKPAGVIEVTDTTTRFVPIVDPVRMVWALLGGFALLLLVTTRRRR
jgi:uncharacterized spore protein YtfJ